MTQQLSATRNQKEKRSHSGFSRKACSDCLCVKLGVGGLQQTAERDALELIDSKDVLYAHVLLQARLTIVRPAWRCTDSLQHVLPMP